MYGGRSLEVVKGGLQFDINKNTNNENTYDSKCLECHSKPHSLVVASQLLALSVSGVSFQSIGLVFFDL